MREVMDKVDICEEGRGQKQSKYIVEPQKEVVLLEATIREKICISSGTEGANFAAKQLGLLNPECEVKKEMKGLAHGMVVGLLTTFITTSFCLF